MTGSAPVPPDDGGLRELRRFTPARIALGRVGSSLPTRSLLEFGVAQAQARDAVTAPTCRQELLDALCAEGVRALGVRSAACDRTQYLRRPDLGRRLHEDDRQALATVARENRNDSADESGDESGDDSGVDSADDRIELVFILADGLSPVARLRHGLPLLRILREALPARRIGPVIVADFARVALGDEIGELLGARQVAMLIGERPGLTAPDSLGVYLTHAPRVGRTDAQRNCISNIRPEGLDYGAAAQLFIALSAGADRLGASGVGLKIAQATRIPI